MSKLEGIQAVVFGAYDTLFDVAGMVFKHEPSLSGKAAEFAALWRIKQFEYLCVRSLAGVHADYWAVTRAALDFTLESLEIEKAGLADELMTGLLQLEAFGGVAQVLQALRSKGRRLAILSNGSPAMLDALIQHAGLVRVFDFVLSIEDIGIYKPSRRAYRLVMQKLQIQDALSICYVSAHGWDAHAAAQFGFQALRLKRGAARGERLPGKLAGTVESLEQVAELL